MKEIGANDLFEYDPDFDLETEVIRRKCYACSSPFERRVSKRSAKYQRLCSQCRHLSDPEHLPRLHRWD
jgi:hypothetical protein